MNFSVTEAASLNDSWFAVCSKDNNPPTALRCAHQEPPQAQSTRRLSFVKAILDHGTAHSAQRRPQGLSTEHRLPLLTSAEELLNGLCARTADISWRVGHGGGVQGQRLQERTQSSRLF